MTEGHDPALDSGAQVGGRGADEASLMIFGPAGPGKDLVSRVGAGDMDHAPMASLSVLSSSAVSPEVNSAANKFESEK